MTYHLSGNSLQIAIWYVRKYGDTDIFPHLPEIAFFRGIEADLLAELNSRELDGIHRRGSHECFAHTKMGVACGG